MREVRTYNITHTDNITIGSNTKLLKVCVLPDDGIYTIKLMFKIGNNNYFVICDIFKIDKYVVRIADHNLENICDCLYISDNEFGIEFEEFEDTVNITDFNYTISMTNIIGATLEDIEAKTDIIDKTKYSLNTRYLLTNEDFYTSGETNMDIEIDTSGYEV